MFVFSLAGLIYVGRVYFDDDDDAAWEREFKDETGIWTAKVSNE